MTGRLVLLGTLLAFVFVADGVAMLATESTSKLGGLVLTLAGCAWFAVAAPRLVKPSVRPFFPVLAAKVGAVALPVLFLPVCALWLIATPSALTVWFAASWAALWLACLVASAQFSCPVCGQVFGRSGPRLRPLQAICAQCGAGPRASAA